MSNLHKSAVLLWCLATGPLLTLGDVAAQGPALPLRLGAPSEDREAADDGEEGLLVMFAGGALELELPVGWKVAEVPHPREIRLVMAPGVVAPGPRTIEDAAWLAYHYHGRALTQDELERRLDARVRLTTGLNLKPRPADRDQIGGRLALTRQFAASGFQGRHWLVPTEWGAVELHLTAPAVLYQQRLIALRGSFDMMKIGDPRERADGIQSPFRDAAPAVGLWKGLHGRIRLTGDGRVFVRADRREEFAIDANGKMNYRRRVPQLAGHYRADGDLIHITWQDGSLLNYRWATGDGELMLTDHLGRVSQLRRHFD